ncbi:MAG: sensor histidine kinase [Pararhodobacter sp.]|nr:sensor histidine kinase [Pararhodobacter sp.]
MRTLIQSALGAASALGPVALDRLDDRERCVSAFEEFVRRTGLFQFAGFVEPDGTMRCSSDGEENDLSGTPAFWSFIDEPAPTILMNPDGDVTGQPSLVIAQPVRDDDEFEGVLIVALPLYALNLVREFGQEQVPTSTILFNREGDVISATPSGLDVEDNIPRGRSLASLAFGGKRLMRGQTENAQTATFTIVPLISDRLYVLGVWAEDDLPTTGAMANPLNLAFPFLMWLASLGVAYFAVHRLVIRHIRTLGRQMRRFAVGQRGGAPEVIEKAPAELRELSVTFSKLARILARDEAELAASLEEKTVLLKEVHHRVKNNLQLIASMISIQSRQVNEPEAREVLKSLQDRVMALATIHQRLYQSDRLAEVQVDRLLDDIVNHLASVSAVPGRHTQIRTELEHVSLKPDQVVPLSLLATEAVTNALKYSGCSEEGGGQIDVRLSRVGEEEVLFEVINSDGAPFPETAAAAGTQLGTKLIQAFSAQLGGHTEQGQVRTASGTGYRLATQFPVTGFRAVETPDAPPSASGEG